jgi:DNA-binding NtrC family response regulator
MELENPAHSDRPANVLIVEDDLLNALLMEETLQLAGHKVRCAKTIDRALALLATCEFDAAIIDLQIGESLSTDVGEKLEQLGIPWAITTGHTRAEVDPKFAEVPMLKKPFTLDSLLDLTESTIHAGLKNGASLAASG